jgi:transposase InsO family protein
MRHEPCGQYQWILHIKDHFNIGPILSSCGPPGSIQCDNGREFKGVLLLLLKRHGVKIINGRPRTPQTQGLVEQGNGTVKDRLRKWKSDNGSSDWV